MAHLEDCASAGTKKEYKAVGKHVAPNLDVDCTGNERGSVPNPHAAVFEILPVARVTGVSRVDITDVQLVYTIEMCYKQVSLAFDLEVLD